MANKWQLEKELKDLCVKCTGLKPSTARKYASELFKKHEDGCISFHTDTEYQELASRKNDLIKALNVLKSGQIESGQNIIKLNRVSRVSFEGESIIIDTLDGLRFSYENEDFKYLNAVFKTTTYY